MENISYNLLNKEDKRLFREETIKYVKKDIIMRNNQFNNYIYNMSSLKDIIGLGPFATALCGITITYVNFSKLYKTGIENDWEYIHKNKNVYMGYNEFNQYKKKIRSQVKNSRFI